MKKYRTTDKIIKNRLGQYASEAPMHLFDRIEATRNMAQTPPKKESRRRYWLILLPLVFVSGTLIYMLSGKDAQDAANTSVTHKMPPVSTAAEVSESASAAQNWSDNTDTPINISENQLDAPPPKQITLPPAKAENLTPKGDQPMAQIITPSSENTITPPALPIISEQVTPSKKEFSEGKIENKPQLTIATSKVAMATKLSPNVPSFSWGKNEEIELDIEPKCGIKDKNGMIFQKSVDVFVSPDYAFRILEYKSDQHAQYAIKRNETESSFYAFNAGMRLNFENQYGWGLRTGLVLTQIHEIFETQYKETVIQTDPVTGDTLGFTEGIRDITTFNRYRMIDVPVLFSYAIPMKKVGFHVNAGVFVNVSSKQKGSFLSPFNEQKVDFTSGQPDSYDIFKKNIGLSIYTGLSVDYQLAKKLQFFVEPHFRYYPRSIAKEEYVLNQKYLTGGVMFGLRKYL